jgi:acylaminoacyl-peptidase
MYIQLAEIPTPTAAEFNTGHGKILFWERRMARIYLLPSADDHGSTIVRLSLSMKNHTRNSKRSLSKLIFSLNNEYSFVEDQPILGTTFEDTSEIALQVISPSKKKRALLRKLGSDKADGLSRYVEIWNDGVLEASVDVSDLHGDFYSDG